MEVEPAADGCGVPSLAAVRGLTRGARLRDGSAAAPVSLLGLPEPVGSGGASSPAERPAGEVMDDRVVVSAAWYGTPTGSNDPRS